MFSLLVLLRFVCVRACVSLLSQTTETNKVARLKPGLFFSDDSATNFILKNDVVLFIAIRIPSYTYARIHILYNYILLFFRDRST